MRYDIHDMVQLEKFCLPNCHNYHKELNKDAFILTNRGVNHSDRPYKAHTQLVRINQAVFNSRRRSKA